MQHAREKIPGEAAQAIINEAALAFDNSGILTDEPDDHAELKVCAAVPEGQVSLLIGAAGANINLIKAASGASFSFTKKETSMHGLRRAFLSGTVSAVTKALMIALSLMAEQGSRTISIVVADRAAGAAIGKGGEHLKHIRETTGCNVNMEKAEEALPGFFGRCLHLSHPESIAAVATAIYMVVRQKGFASPDQQSSRTTELQAYGGGAGAGSPTRGSPYAQPPMGAMGGRGADATSAVCAIHGKRRGRSNLQPNASGQLVCLEQDACKGSQHATPLGGGYAGMGLHGLGGMGSQNTYITSMGGVMSGLGGGYGQQAHGGAIFCATHNKKRGASNVQPHPSIPGAYVCSPGDECK